MFDGCVSWKDRVSSSKDKIIFCCCKRVVDPSLKSTRAEFESFAASPPSFLVTLFQSLSHNGLWRTNTIWRYKKSGWKIENMEWVKFYERFAGLIISFSCTRAFFYSKVSVHYKQNILVLVLSSRREKYIGGEHIFSHPPYLIRSRKFFLAVPSSNYTFEPASVSSTNFSEFSIFMPERQVEVR